MKEERPNVVLIQIRLEGHATQPRETPSRRFIGNFLIGLAASAVLVGISRLAWSLM
jgi:hypothetical protein